MARVTRIEKDPADVIDYEIEWSDLLDTDTIASASWSIATMTADPSAPGTTLSIGTGPYAPSIPSATRTRVWLRDGKRGEIYRVSCAIVTAASPARTLERSIEVWSREL